MNKREMKVYRGSTKDYEPVPKITIQGKWLDELGFSIGDRFTVTCKEGSLSYQNPKVRADNNRNVEIHQKEG